MARCTEPFRQSLENLRDDLVELGKRKDLLEEAAVVRTTDQKAVKYLARRV